MSHRASQILHHLHERFGRSFVSFHATIRLLCSRECTLRLVTLVDTLLDPSGDAHLGFGALDVVRTCGSCLSLGSSGVFLFPVIWQCLRCQYEAGWCRFLVVAGSLGRLGVPLGCFPWKEPGLGSHGGRMLDVDTPTRTVVPASTRIQIRAPGSHDLYCIASLLVLVRPLWRL